MYLACGTPPSLHLHWIDLLVKQEKTPLTLFVSKELLSKQKTPLTEQYALSRTNRNTTIRGATLIHGATAAAAFFSSSLLRRRLVLYCIHKQNGQPDISGAGHCQQDAEHNADRLHRFPQVTAGEDDPQQRQQQQHDSEPKRHMLHPPYTPRNASIISVNHFSSRVKRARSCAGDSRPLPLSKKPRPL